MCQKTCKLCKALKDRDQFYTSSEGRRSNECLVCRRVLARLRTAIIKDKGSCTRPECLAVYRALSAEELRVLGLSVADALAEDSAKMRKYVVVKTGKSCLKSVDKAVIASNPLNSFLLMPVARP